MKNEPKKPRRAKDPEIVAMQRCHDLLTMLSHSQRERVLDFLRDKLMTKKPDEPKLPI